MLISEKLVNATANSHLCVGLDPVLEKLPEPLRDRKKPVLEFLLGIVEKTWPYVAAYKPNLAFFETMGQEGDEALEATISRIRELAPGCVVIGDGKRGDIGSTAEKYASAMFDRWGFDMTTVNPYFGSDGILPFVEREDKGVYLLAATSNPSAVEIQNDEFGGFLPVRVAELTVKKWNKNRNVGLVVGATRTETMERIRKAGSDIPWLIPGIGAQGGDLAKSLGFGLGEKGRIPSLINASRSVIYASKGEDFAEKAGLEAKALNDAINEAREIKT